MTANPAPRPALRRAPDADAHPARPWAGPANGSTLVARQALVAPTLSPATPTQRRATGDVSLVPVTALPGRGTPATDATPGSNASGPSGKSGKPGKAAKRGKAGKAADQAKVKLGKAPKASWTPPVRTSVPAAVTTLVAPPSATSQVTADAGGAGKAAKAGKAKRAKTKPGKGAAAATPASRPVSPIDPSPRRGEGRPHAGQPMRADVTAQSGGRVTAASPGEGARRRASVPAVAVVAPRRGADDLIGSTAGASRATAPATSPRDAGTAAGSPSPRTGAPGVQAPTTVVLQVELPPALARRAEARATDLGYALPDAVRELLTLWTEQ